jgi:hypothetical protein
MLLRRRKGGAAAAVIITIIGEIKGNCINYSGA